MMIFDGGKVTEYVIKWKETHDHTVMDSILLESTSLVEAIVSKYDQVYRDDLIQESMSRLMYACEFFNPEISTLHNFFTTVIHNTCNTFVVKQEREYLLDDSVREDDDSSDIIELPDTSHADQYELSADTMLTDLICYMRKRFPSLPAATLDDCAEIIYYGLRNGEQTRMIMSELTKMTLSRSVSVMIYNVVIVYMRWKNISCSTVDIDDVAELSLLHELKMIVGDSAYSKIVVTFAGMTLRFPQ